MKTGVDTLTFGTDWNRRDGRLRREMQETAGSRGQVRRVVGM